MVNLENRTVRDVCALVNLELKARGLEIDEYGMQPSTFDGDHLFPDCRWIACYAVTGGSEGHYIHVDAIKNDMVDAFHRKVELVMLGKTFQGMDFATRVAAALSQILGA